MSWTPERVETLKRLWDKGLSASAIAARLGDGVTRNAVISKLHRSGLSGRAQNVSTQNRITRMRMPAAKVKAPTFVRHSANTPMASIQPELYTPQPDIVIPLVERKALADLEPGDCRWPIGDPRDNDFHFCARPHVSGLPYCEHHARRAYETVEARRAKKMTAAAQTQRKDEVLA